ncbi:hypothetical protein HYV30_00725 [Candidatus Kaiserbacteria bacterium]|nr:hypothetical protein [Candidatus Kaiserbacteria bacterium]
MRNIIRIGTVGLSSLPLALYGASLAHAQATTTPPATGAGAAADLNLLLLAGSIALFAGSAVYMRRALAKSK